MQAHVEAPRAARVPLTGRRYGEADDWRGFVERSMSSLHDPEVAYYVSQALEECHTLAAINADRETPWIAAGGTPPPWERPPAGEAPPAPGRRFGSPAAGPPGG